MGEVTPGVVVISIIAVLVVLYLVVRAASSAAINSSRQGAGEKRAWNRAGGLYLDNLGRINEGLGILSPRSDSEKERLRELKQINEKLSESKKEPEWVVTELEKINDEVRSF